MGSAVASMIGRTLRRVAIWRPSVIEAFAAASSFLTTGSGWTEQKPCGYLATAVMYSQASVQRPCLAIVLHVSRFSNCSRSCRVSSIAQDNRPPKDAGASSSPSACRAGDALGSRLAAWASSAPSRRSDKALDGAKSRRAS